MAKNEILYDIIIPRMGSRNRETIDFNWFMHVIEVTKRKVDNACKDL